MKYYIKKLIFNTIFVCSNVLVRSTLNSLLPIFYTWVKRGTVRVTFRCQEHNAVNIAVPQPAVKFGVPCPPLCSIVTPLGGFHFLVQGGGGGLTKSLAVYFKYYLTPLHL